MPLTKCQRCELNYITDGEEYCTICKRELKGERQREEIELCTICNESPSLPGKDICLFCLKEMDKANNTNEEEKTRLISEDSLAIDPVSSMEEIIPEIDEDILEGDFNEVDSSLDAMRDDEVNDHDESELN